MVSHFSLLSCSYSIWLNLVLHIAITHAEEKSQLSGAGDILIDTTISYLVAAYWSVACSPNEQNDRPNLLSFFS